MTSSDELIARLRLLHDYLEERGLRLHAQAASNAAEALTRSNDTVEPTEEMVAKAICDADGGQWRLRTEKPVPGLPHDYDFDKLNNRWRHLARAAIKAMRSGGG